MWLIAKTKQDLLASTQLLADTRGRGGIKRTVLAMTPLLSFSHTQEVLVSLDLVTAAWRQLRLTSPTLSAMIRKASGAAHRHLQRGANQRRHADSNQKRAFRTTGYRLAEAAQSNGSGQHVENIGVVLKQLLLAYATL